MRVAEAKIQMYLSGIGSYSGGSMISQGRKALRPPHLPDPPMESTYDRLSKQYWTTDITQEIGLLNSPDDTSTMTLFNPLFVLLPFYIFKWFF